MSRIPDEPRTDLDADVPRALRDDLMALYAGPRVPPALDAKILNAAATTRARLGRQHHRLWWAGAGAAVAAAAAAVVLVVLHLPASRPADAPPRVAGDVNADGRVDVLDAFALARQLRDAGGKPLPAERWDDLNGDGTVDATDVDLIARLAVRATPPPRVARSDGPAPRAGVGHSGGNVQ